MNVGFTNDLTFVLAVTEPDSTCAPANEVWSVKSCRSLVILEAVPACNVNNERSTVQTCFMAYETY